LALPGHRRGPVSGPVRDPDSETGLDALLGRPDSPESFLLRSGDSDAGGRSTAGSVLRVQTDSDSAQRRLSRPAGPGGHGPLLFRVWLRCGNSWPGSRDDSDSLISSAAKQWPMRWPGNLSQAGPNGPLTRKCIRSCSCSVRVSLPSHASRSPERPPAACSYAWARGASASESPAAPLRVTTGTPGCHGLAAIGRRICSL
jgi:hypothetical protein